MSRRIRIATFAAMVPVLLLAAAVGYALAGRNTSGDTPPFPGFRLVRPAFAQATPAFPVPDAGISAYVKVPATSVNFDKIIPLFQFFVAAGDNYMIGRTSISRSTVGVPIDVHVYVDKSGWIVAYLTKDKLAADVFTWTLFNPLSPKLDTVLGQALATTATAIGQTVDSTKIAWYDWANPGATHLAAGVRYAQSSTSLMFMQIPVAAIVYGKPSYSFQALNTVSLTQTKLGGLAQLLESNVNFLTIKELNMDLGAMYIFDITPIFGHAANLGLAVVYKAP
jgi:hypothetical protein